MNKAEAIEKMQSGIKMPHTSFSQEEWVTMNNGQILLEDGVKCSPEEFWKWRTGQAWDNDWSIWEA